MVNTFRVLGLTCAMLVATVSLYFFTMFWTWIGIAEGYDKAITQISQQRTNLVNPVKKFFKEKLAYLKQKA